MSWQRSSRRTARAALRGAGEAVQGALQREGEIAGAAVKEAPLRYGRAQFVQDAAWLGLDAERAFSRLELRRQRDRLMSTHHPDRGGAEEIAARINETYERMAGWLAKRRFRRESRRLTELEILARKPAESRQAVSRSPLLTAVQIGAVQLSALALMAAVGYTTFRRRRPKG
jgi:hypothetical protein